MIKKRYIFIPLVVLSIGVLVIGVLAYFLFSGKSGGAEVVFAATEVGTPVGDKVNKSIGPAGGTLVSPDGRLTLTVPPNALTEFVEFSIQPITNKMETGIGNGYRLEPSGRTFMIPLKLSVHFDEKDIEGTVPEALTVAYQDKDGAWHEQKTAKVDQVAKTITIPTTHFTDFSFFARMQISPAEATVGAGKMIAIKAIECNEPSRWDRLMGHPPVCGQPGHSLEAKWKLRGPGKIIDGGAYRAAYLAPDSKPTPNVVWVDLLLELDTLDPETGATVTAQKTFSAKITITGKSYKASGTAGDTVVSGVICDLDKSFKLQTNNPFLEGLEFTPSSPSFGNWEISTKNGVVGGGGGQYVLEGPADNRIGITLNGFSSGYGQGSGRRTPTLSGGGTMHLTLTPLTLNPTTKDACSE